MMNSLKYMDLKSLGAKAQILFKYRPRPKGRGNIIKKKHSNFMKINI